MRYGRLIFEGNLRTNLVGARSLDELVTAHFLDSLAPLQDVRLANPVIDLGSGAGLPGIVVAIARPRTRVICLEPRTKRAEFLRAAIPALGLRNVEVLQRTGQTAGRGKQREVAGSVLARAIAAPLLAVELAFPLVRLGGSVVLYAGRRAGPASPELGMAALLGGELQEAKRVFVPYLDAERHVWIFRKTKRTPSSFPRRRGLPRRQPLKLP